MPKGGAMMNQKERMLSGLPYKAWLDGLPEERLENRKRIYEYNHCKPRDSEKMDRLIRDILGKAGVGVHIEAPFYCDYGKNIHVGDYFYANFNCVILDVGRVIIGHHVKIGPNVSLYTAGHPIHPDSRNSGYEYGIGITIGTMFGLGKCVVNPGVHIGKSGDRFGKRCYQDIPDHVVAAGNPCKVIREITEKDRKYYYKDHEFDVED